MQAVISWKSLPTAVQDRDRFREQVLGFNKSTAQKAVHAAKKNRLTSGGKDDIIKESMNRRNKNIGEFSELKIPMQKKAILNVCKKYNVETSGLRFKMIDCQVKCNTIREKNFEAPRRESEN